ncbi:MAG: isochorismatase family protein [Acidimicrobiaceae bacterium]|nr:isochorismatase family protein [Acidimicrobiaceae bacterium]
MEEGWRRFLTENDNALIAATSWAKKKPFGLGDRPALLIVDDYYAALGYPRMDILEAVKNWPSACGMSGWEAIDRTVNLLDSARSAGIPVFYTTSFGRRPTPWNRKGSTVISPKGDGPGPYDIAGEIAPFPEDTIIEKSTPSAFQGTSLEIILRSQNRDTVLVCGEATSGCVRSTVVDACTAGFAVGIIGECCFDRFEASHWMSLFDMNQKYGDLVDIDDVKAYLKSLP